MSQKPELTSLSFTQRVVLLSIVDGELDDETPLTSLEIKDRCRNLLDRIDVDPLSTPAERDIMRALNGLGADPSVEEHHTRDSPIGKGRPQYSLAIQPEMAVEILADDERFEDAIEAVRA